MATTTDVRKIAQDAAYVSVGVGVLAFQKAQVARREARVRFERQVEDTRQRLTSGAAGARERLESTVGDVRARVIPVREQLQARIDPVAQQVRSRVEPFADHVQERLPQPLAKLVEAGRDRTS